MTRRRLATWYFAAQGIAVPAWWLTLYASPGSRAAFLPDARLEPSFAAFVVPDCAVLGFGSLAVCYLGGPRPHVAKRLALLVFGALLYATLYTAAWVVFAGAPGLALALMALATVACGLAVRHVV